MSFARVATRDDVWIGDMLPVRIDGKEVLLVNLGDVVVALEDRCAHQAFPLSRGRLEGAVLTCAAHEWTYDARTGRGINPARACLRRYAVRLDGDDIWVDIDQLLEERAP